MRLADKFSGGTGKAVKKGEKYYSNITEAWRQPPFQGFFSVFCFRYEEICEILENELK